MHTSRDNGVHGKGEPQIALPGLLWSITPFENIRMCPELLPTLLFPPGPSAPIFRGFRLPNPRPPQSLVSGAGQGEG